MKISKEIKKHLIKILFHQAEQAYIIRLPIEKIYDELDKIILDTEYELYSSPGIETSFRFFKTGKTVGFEVGFNGHKNQTFCIIYLEIMFHKGRILLAIEAEYEHGEPETIKQWELKNV